MKVRANAQRPWIDRIGPYLTLLFTVGLFATAVGQWRAADRQAATAEALQRLEYARSSARFAFNSAGSRPFGPRSSPRLIELPYEIGVKPVGGVDAILGLNSEVLLVLSEARSNGICRVLVRGLYDFHEGSLVLGAASSAGLNKLVEQFVAQGLEIGAPNYNVLVTYTDVFSQFRLKNFQIDKGGAIEIEGTRPTSLILYSGRWSSGSGYYFDEPGTPERNCPRFAKKIEAAITAAGGRPPAPAEVDKQLNELIKRRGLEVPGVTN